MVTIYEGALNEDGTRVINLEMNAQVDVEGDESRDVHIQVLEMAKAIMPDLETVDRHLTPVKVWVALTKQLFFSKAPEAVEATPLSEIIEPQVETQEVSTQGEATPKIISSEEDPE